MPLARGQKRESLVSDIMRSVKIGEQKQGLENDLEEVERKKVPS